MLSACSRTDYAMMRMALSISRLSSVNIKAACEWMRRGRFGASMIAEKTSPKFASYGFFGTLAVIIQHMKFNSAHEAQHKIVLNICNPITNLTLK